MEQPNWRLVDWSIGGWVDGWINSPGKNSPGTDGRTDRRTDRRTDGPMDRRTGGEMDYGFTADLNAGRRIEGTCFTADCHEVFPQGEQNP